MGISPNHFVELAKNQRSIDERAMLKASRLDFPVQEVFFKKECRRTQPASQVSERLVILLPGIDFCKL